MKITKYILGLFVISLITIISCNNDDLKNPVLTDTDLTVYFWGEGDDVRGIAWEGYDVLIGETLDLKLQVSPKTDTEVKWVDSNTGEVLSETLEYTYAPTQEESRRVNFVASRPSGYEVVVPFNFRGNTDGNNSVINQWQSFLIPEGTQTGDFTFEFDVIPSKDIIDGIVGILDGVSTTYSDISCIFRFNGAGMIDAYNMSGYEAMNELAYSAGVTYHVRMDVDAVNMTYNVYVSEQGGEEVVIAENFGFRKQITHLNYWAIVAGDYNIADPGTHRVFNEVFTVHSQNEAPVFKKVEDVVLPEGQMFEVEIEAIDPLGGAIKLTGIDLPRFATFTDIGFGKGLISLNPYDNCGGCDLGEFNIQIVATNAKESTELNFNVEIIDPYAAFDIVADTGDATIWKNGALDNEWTQLFGGAVDAGVGGNDQVIGVIPFALPDVPAGKKVKSAVLTVNVVANNAWVAVEYDVYALGVRPTSQVVSTDFFAGAFDTDPNATGIQKGLIVNGAGTGSFSMDDSSSSNLANYMNTEYSNGASQGEFIFLRIGANRSDMPTWAHLQYDSANVVGGTKPILTITLEEE